MSSAGLRHRPILGGVFGMGRYALASIPCVMRGLHAVRFMVIEPTSGAVLSIADDKVDALDAARAQIQAGEQLALQQAAPADPDGRQGELWPPDELPARPVVDKRRPISKRRRAIYAKSRGCCHYCTTPLQLDGSWHVEHMLPRALGGADEISNLVASCAPCNLSKGDRTALEFVLEGSVPEGAKA